MAGTFDVLQSKGGQFYFVLKAGNGQVILNGEQYVAKPSCLNGVESVRANAPDGARFDRREAKDGSPYFVLKAANGKVIGQSQMYKSAATMEKGVASVQSNAQKAKVVDRTA